METLRDEVEPQEKWEFGTDVARVFDDMLERSIPQYQLMRELTYRLGSRFVAADADLLDIGCSRGGAMVRFADGIQTRRGRITPRRIVGIEVSEPMADAADRRFTGNDTVQVRRHDLRGGLPEDLDCGLILAVLTLQFTPIEYRQRLFQQAYDRLRPGGALLVVEKVLGDGAMLNDVMVEEYHDAKRSNGYSAEQIERKRLSLEGVLVPVTAHWNEEMMGRAGFAHVDCFWRYLNFCGWLAVKGEG